MTDFRKKILARMKRKARVETEGTRFYEDYEVKIGEIEYRADVTVSYGADWEPESGDGWNEPREGGYFSVGIEIQSIEAWNCSTYDAEGNCIKVTDPAIIEIIKAQFLRLYESKIEEEISKGLEEDAESDAEPDFDKDDYDDRF